MTERDPTLDAVRWVPRTIEHFGDHSGYEPLFRHMGMQAAASPWAMRFADGIPKSLAWRLWALRPQATQASGLRAELGAMPWAARGRGRVLHFIFGEDTFMYTPLWLAGRNRSIATFHYPPSRLALRINPGAVKTLAAAVIVGENQRAHLEQLLPAEKIHYCPHALDADFFCPADAPQTATAVAHAAAPQRLFCSGSTFRDYATLRAVVERVRVACFPVELDVVGASDEQRALLHGLPGVVLHRGVSDEALRDLYRRATVGVLPLTDATANNALLEMMGCGCAVVASRVGGLPGYTEGSAVELVEPGDAQAMSTAVISLLADPARRAAAGAANRRHAERRLSYRVVALRMREIYAACAAPA